MGNRSMLYRRTSWSRCMLFGISVNIQCKVSTVYSSFSHQIAIHHIFLLIEYLHSSRNSYKDFVMWTFLFKKQQPTTTFTVGKCHTAYNIVWLIRFFTNEKNLFSLYNTLYVSWVWCGCIVFCKEKHLHHFYTRIVF